MAAGVHPNYYALQNHLPFSAEDLGWGFSFTEHFWNSELPTNKISNYKQVHETYLVDPNTCVFFSKFGLINPFGTTTTWKSGCGDTIRWSASEFTAAGISTMTNPVNIKPFESYMVGLAGWRMLNLKKIDLSC